jgi:hypothetical protein
VTVQNTVKELSVMFKGTGTLKLAVSVFVLVAGVGSVKMLQSSAPADPLKEWSYPKAKRGLEGISQPPLVWAKFTTTDAFEKVWKFYWQKVTEGAPVKLPPSIKSRTLYSEAPPEQKICAHFRDDNPTARMGVFVIREKQQTISITIVRRAEEKETVIVAALDLR